MARKALSVYVQRLEHAYNTNVVRDPVELYQYWKCGVTPAIVNDTEAGKSWLRSWWAKPETRYNREEHWQMIANMGLLIATMST